jgi:peptide/nickel transport system permease protein
MGRPLLERLARTALVLLGASLLLFALTLAIPGNPAQVLLGPRATPEAISAFTHAMGLDQPLPVRLGRFLGHLLSGDLGTDVVSGRPVRDMVLEVLPATLLLAAAAIGLAVALGVPLGCYAATHPGGVIDQALAIVSVSVIAVPSFVVALLLLLVFSAGLHWLPVIGGGASGLLLPALSLALGWIGYIARLLRASLLEVLGADHVRTLDAYGVPRRRIVLRFALRLAAVPVLAVLGVGIGRLLGGAVLVEIVFARPGLGTLVFDAIGNRDYPVVQGSVLVVVVMFTLANLAVDLLLLRLDPRAT